ncbi:FAD-binding oxidoreductase [Roseinatronobacter alkalisoli]|uniref:FAD-binding oxidoreductase n=1 Tax=Roseinatronobacter alkalisoli TaxID=3028235 RepID=A0ABT5TAR5_9RHOB|nr:FAD-binding oxidoreductase [Roseinatronobacter sp. HJB301]MDD7971810.1 FAD-binding oxidoreductase [Roseinatronobacter sp. HJB301]
MTLTPCTADFLNELSPRLPEGTLRAPAPRFLEEPRGRWQGQAGAVACPSCTEDVATILRAANDARVAVVPYGGGTGLVGGQVAADGASPLVLSLERMRNIRAVHPAENVLIAEAGAILADVQKAAEDAGRLFPLSLASEGSAQIGGLLATNAGGVNVLRYGNARDLVLGLEVVMPDGRIWNGLKRLRKDNTGYDLRHLLIGSEGTLGVITAASLRLFARPARQGAALMVVQNPAAALALLALAQTRLAEGISAFELISGMGLEFLARTMPQVRQPFAAPPEWMVLIDLGLPQGIDPSGALEALFADALDAGFVSDGVIAQNMSQRAEFWSLRESIPEANRHIGAVSSHDISLPLSAVPEFIDRAGPALAGIGEFRVNCFGHLGDGNLHYNVFPTHGRSRADHDHQRDRIKTCVHDLVHDMGGSVSAEHGIGRLKTGDLEKYGDPVKLAAMRAIKHALDPNGIMNPGAVLTDTEMQRE